MSESGQNSGSEGLARSKGRPSEGDTTRSGSVSLDFQESLPLKDRMALYQAAVSNKSQSSSTNMLEQSEDCTVPGGLASMKKHFEKSEVASSHSAVSQYQYQHKSVKETRRTNEVTITNSMEAAEQQAYQAETQFSASETEQLSAHKQSTQETSAVSNYNQKGDGVAYEEIPKVSAQVIKEQYERSLKEKNMTSGGNFASDGKQAKIYYEYPEFEWPVVNANQNGSTSKSYDEMHTMATKHTSTVNAGCANFGSLEEFPPPPPPDILEASDIAEFSQSPEPVSSAERHVPTVSKDVYSKQRNLYELKRLYKHIHPEVRKNLQKEYFNEVSDIVSSQCAQGSVQQAKYTFENSRDSPQKCLSPERENMEWDEILKGEVRSMRWVFENQPLDSIKDDSPEQSHIKSIGEQEIIAGGDVKYTTWMFETQPIHALSADASGYSDNGDKVPELARGDVRTATWLFETQPLDALNRIYKEKSTSEMADMTEDIRGGDVKTGRYLFETQFLDGQLCSIDERNTLRLTSELQEFKGDVKRTVKQFETEPKYVLKDSSGNVLEIKTVCREDIEKGDVKTARWMFETQPLDTINQNEVEVKVVRGISMEESVKGGVGKAKWLFETQPLDTIKEQDESVIEKEAIVGSDVCQKCWIFETVPMDKLKDNANERPQFGEEIIGGDVSNTKHLFETVPIDELKENDEVGRLKQVANMEEEKGDVRHQRWVFETKPLEQIRDEKKEYIRTVKLEDIHSGDVSNYKNAFETENWSTSDLSYKIKIEDVDKGAVKSNKKLFETTPLYAIQDRFGHYHEVQTIRQEEVVRGDVRTCQWMFETIPIDQFEESVENYQLIKGISSQEIQSGDVKTAKWLFETQPLDSIKYFSNVEDEEVTNEDKMDIVKGDVKMCKQLFETQPMETLYDKDEKITDHEEILKGDVKTCTWLFESQPLDLIQDESEKNLYSMDKEKIEGRDVQKVCFLFETQNLENIQGEERMDFKRVVEIDVQSGDVSTMKYIFEHQALDQISSSSEEVLQKIKSMKKEDLQNGNVLNCRWLFENHSIDEINAKQNENQSDYVVTDVQGGNVKKGCFIFETFSLDQIKDERSEDQFIRTVNKNEIMKGDVKNYKLMFETQPLYAIQDKEGFYHEVTTVKKEEVSHGNVRGTRWLFETKPLDSINDSDEVFIIKSVTQEDIQRGDVSSVRYRFETQSLDTISDDIKAKLCTVEDIQGGNVMANRQLFEKEDDEHQFVRTVSISEIKQGNVKTSTWLFETHTIDEIHGDDYENIKTVTMEDVHIGDVQEAVWLFENQPLDSIKEVEENITEITKEEIPQADVRTTTWLFETTPLHEFNEQKIERKDIVGKSIQETLKELYSNKIVNSHGIILEADEIGDIRMAKYKLMNQENPEIQREEILRGDLQNIMMNLLSQNNSTERMVLLNDEEKGNIHLTKSQLLNSLSDVQFKREDVVGGDVQEAIKKLFNSEDSVKQGILIQESEKGDIKMTIYSLLNKSDNDEIQRDDVLGGDIKRTIYNLKSSAIGKDNLEKVKIEDSERGNVQFYTTCIESGALDYLNRLQRSSDDIVVEKEEEEIIGGDVEATKRLLKKQQYQIERTVDEADIIPGDVCNTVKVFMTEPDNTSFDINKEDVVKGDLRATLNSLSQAINQPVIVEKEEIIKADLSATLKSLTDSQYQTRATEKPDVIPGDIHGAIDSLEKAVNMKTEFVKEEVVHGNLEQTLKSLKEAQQLVKEVEKEDVIRGDINTTVQNLLYVSAESKNVQHQVSVQGDVKSTMKTLLQPSVQTIQRRASIEGDVKNTIKTLLQSNEKTQSEKKVLTTGGVSVDKIISVGLDNKSHTANSDYRNQESINILQQKVTESCDALADNVTLKNDRREKTNDFSAQSVDSRNTTCTVNENDLKLNRSETNKAWKKHSTLSNVQTAEQICGEKICLPQGLSKGHKEKISTDQINQNKVMQKAKLSSSINTSKSTASQQAINMINRERYQVSDHVRKQMTNQQAQNTQYSRKTIAQNEVTMQQAQVLDSINNNVENAEKVHILMDKGAVTKESEKKEDIHVTEKKSVQKVAEKSKSAFSRVDHQFVVKNHTHSTKLSENHENLKRNTSPAPTPSTQLPLPPPPPPLPILSSLKANIERENFPSPPPPVTDKLEHESLPPPPPLPVTPPPLIQYKELSNTKGISLSQHEQVLSQSEQCQSYTDNYMVKQSGHAQKSIKTEQGSKNIEKQKPVVPHKSKLPVFQHKKGDMAVTQNIDRMQKSKQVTTSESTQKVSMYQSTREDTEQLTYNRELETINQAILPPKSKVLVSPKIPPALKTGIASMKHKVVDVTNAHINESRISSKQATFSVQAQNSSTSHSKTDIEQIACDNKLETVHQGHLQPKKKVYFSPSISPELLQETPQMKQKIEDMANANISESSLSSREATYVVSAQNTSTCYSKTEDSEQLECDRELERIHQESLQPKKKMFFSPTISPALQNDSSRFRSKVEGATATQINKSNISSKDSIISVSAQIVSTSQPTEEELEQLACDRELEQIHQETLKPKKKVFFPPRVSPALRTDTPQMKPKPYARKFKTPLMIAEEKYRQQREEMEKNKGKITPQFATSMVNESKVIHFTEDSEITKSASNELQRMQTTTDLNYVKDSVPTAKVIDTSNTKREFQNVLDINMQMSDVNILPKSEASSLEAQRKNEQHIKVVNECNTLQQTNEQHSLNTSEKLNKFAQLPAKNRIISPKLEVKPGNESTNNVNMSEINVKQINKIETMKQSKNAAHLMQQRVTDESQRAHFSEKSLSQKINTQSISHSSEQQKLDKTSNVQAVSNEVETKKAQSKHVGISVIKRPGSLSPQTLRKEHVKTDNEVKQNIFDIQTHPEKPKGFQECKVQHQESPPQKRQVQEKNAVTQSIVKDRQMHKAQTKNENTEKNQLSFSSMDKQTKDDIKSADVMEYLRKCEELQQIVSKGNTLESNPNILNKNTFRTFLNIVPTWLVSQEKKDEIASSDSGDIMKHISHIKQHALEMHSSFESTVHAAIRSSPISTMKARHESITHSGISQKQMSAVSKKVETTSRVVQEKKVSNEFSRVANDIKQSDFRSCSPSLKTRSPSPTYITIESTARRTESPQKDRPPCISPLQKEPTTVPLPPKRSVTPKVSVSPSPQKSRSEQLAKLKDTTAKLSQGTAQPRAVTPVPIVVEKKCEIVHSPATLRRQLKIESHATETISTKTIPASEVTVSVVKGRKGGHEQAKKSEVHKIQKDPKHIPEWLGQDLDSLDLISVTQKFEGPTVHAFEAKEKMVYTKEKPTFKMEKKDEVLKADETEATNININTNRTKFHREQKSSQQGNQRGIIEVPERNSSVQDASKGRSRTVPIRQIKGPKENTSKQIYVNKHHENKEHLFNPMLHSETISITEQVSGVDKVEKIVGRSRLPQSSESIKPGFDFKHAPPTYEDVISGHMLDISAAESPEELLKNFQKTWEESERVFKSLGYTVSDTSEMRSSYHQEEVITENAASGKGIMHCLSKEGLSNGMPSDRQADLS
ncbi:xin actin-binding repeat-containing protein 2 [Discoglossus pictus]